MPLSGVFKEKEKQALAKRILDFYEDVRYNYLSAKEDPREYGTNWKKSIKKLREDFDGLGSFSEEIKRYLKEDLIFSDESLNPNSHTASQIWEAIKEMRYNSPELNDPFAKQLGDKVIETLVGNPSIYAMFLHYALRTHTHSIKSSAWEAQDLKPDELTEGAMGLDLEVKDIPLYIVEHYGDDVDTSRVKSKFKGALQLLEKVYNQEHSEEEWKALLAIKLKKAENPIIEKDEEEEKSEIVFINPSKPMYRIFEIDDIKELKGFSGEWVVQEKYDGIRIQIHKMDDKIEIFTYNEKNITDKCDKIVDRLKTKKIGDVILDAELILYDDDEPLHRADTIAHLFKNKYKDASLRAKIFDIMHHEGKDVTGSPLRERINILFYQLAPNSSEECGFPSKKNTRIADSITEIEKYAKDIMDSPTSEGVVIKDIESSYYIGGKKNPKWIKWKKFVDLDVIVLNKSKTKSNLYSYTLGVGPLTGEEARTYNGIEYEGKTYLKVGKALNTKESVAIGSIVRVKVDEVRKKGDTFSLYSAKVIEIPEIETPDKVITLELLSQEGKKTLKYDVQEALFKYSITDGVHGEADIILKSDFEGFTIYGFTGDNLMTKNALAEIDLWKEQITDILKTKSSDARMTIKEFLQQPENKDGLSVDKILSFCKENIPKITKALWEDKARKLRNWMNDQDEFIALSSTEFKANPNKLIKVTEDTNATEGIFKLYIRKDDNIDFMLNINDKVMGWIIDIEDSEDVYNLFGKSGKFPAQVSTKAQPDKLLDKGKLILGVQKHGYHEYKIIGDKFESRIHFRVVPVNKQDTWIAWTGIKQEMLDKEEDEGIWDINEDRHKKLTIQMSE